MKPRLFLNVGYTVRHLHQGAWGEGQVVEEKHSVLPGGICMVRILFEDGIARSFINDLDSELCCYYAGIRILRF